MVVVANRDLRSEDIPPSDNDWRAFTRFALTINGYDFPNHYKWADIFENPIDRSLTDLRVCLFMFQRMIRWTERYPDEEEWLRINRVLSAVRALVASGKLEDVRMSETWLKMIGLSERPAPEIYDKSYVEFRGSQPHVQCGDYMVLYAVGGSKRVFALVEVTSAVYHSGPGGEDWPFRVNVDYIVNVPVSSGPHIGEVGKPKRNLLRSLQRRSHIRLKAEEYEQLASKLRSVSESERNAE